jgi:hypothetical protein
MSYIPTKEDFDEPIKKTGGYIPSMEDFEEEKPNKSLMERLKDIGGAVLHGTERAAQVPMNIGSALAQHGLNLAEDVGNIPNLLSGGYIPKLAGHIEAPMQNPEAPESQITENLLKGGEYAAPVAGLAHLGMAGAQQIPALAKLGERIGSSAVDEGKNLIQNLLGNTKIDKAHQPVLDELRKNYSSTVKNSNENYGLLKKLAKERGYYGQSSLERAMGQKNAKSIEAQSSLNDIDKLPIKDDPLEDFVKKFKEMPSFENAHNMQSRLGSEGRYLLTSPDKIQKSLGAKYLNIRKDFVNDILDSFKKNKDSDLAQGYRNATSWHKQNVVPYEKNRSINQVVTKRDLEEVNPENIHNTLTKDDESVKRVVQDLSPQSKNLMIAKKLSPAIEQSETQGMNVDPQKLMQQLSKINTGKFNKLLSPENRDLIRNLEEQLQFDRKYKEPAKKGLKYAGGLGLGAAGLGGLYGLKKEAFG